MIRVLKVGIFVALLCAVAAAQGSNAITLGVYNSSAPTLSNGNYSPLQLDSSGNLKVNIVAGSSGNAAASATGSAVPASADYTGVNVGGTLRGLTGVNPSGSIYAGQFDLASVAGTTTDTNTGNASAGTIRMVLATNQPNLTSALNVSAAQSGTWTTRAVGNAGAAFDAAQNATAPANVLAEGGVYNSAQISTLTSGNLSALQVDGKGALFTRSWNGCPAGAYYEAGFQYLPNASTSLTATATCVDAIYLTNKDTAQHTASVQDQSTACNTAACQILTSYPLPPGAFVRLPMDGSKMTGGIKWNADAANVVVANIIGKQ
jgi:hypothetical protein